MLSDAALLDEWSHVNLGKYENSAIEKRIAKYVHQSFLIYCRGIAYLHMIRRNSISHRSCTGTRSPLPQMPLVAPPWEDGRHGQ